MFAKLSALLLALPFVAATITVGTPDGWTTGGTVTFTWTAATTDPSTFSIELVNAAFHDTFAIANNVQTVNGQLTVELPQVPVTAGYTLSFFAPNDVNNVYAQTGSFTIGGATTSSATAASTSSTSATSSASSMSFSTPSVTATIISSPASVSVPTTGTGTGTGTNTAATSTPSSFNSSGATSFKLAGVVPAAALVLSVVAGAVMVF
ncbi:hypothetical protein JVT61DRAFT_4897 [Boletus reticuloceps]|uniref:Yeast cell wall synthesis Kre9/Knh1-like N-terminal domain-containing protein n=1 Tax=Boletus reticuloceps TaxID=495285 RepID=A0A8I3AEM4_9AGAM|nr:hypothetical protein JVT61DRAFT_4897 [Boletus reticuloceps]